MAVTAYARDMLGATAEGGSTANRRELKIRDVMSQEVTTAAPGDTVFAAVKRMSENNVSCVVVVDDGGQVMGIMTEKDVLRAVGGEDIDFHRLRVSQCMASSVQSVSPDMSVLAAGRIMEAGRIKRLPVLDGRRLAGIVTQTDITRGLVAMSPLTSISDIMTTSVATIATTATVSEAARVMASRGISCIIAMHRDEAAGILTEKDLLRRVVALRRDAARTQVADVMSFPVVAVPPSYSVLSAGRKMESIRLHRLAVMEDRKVCGIITQTDIMKAIRDELERLDNDRREWAKELCMLTQHTLDDLQRLQDALGRAAGTRSEFAADPTGIQTDGPHHSAFH